MCGGGGYEPYSAYKSGDFDAWKNQFDKIAEIELAAARGEIPQEQAQAQLEALRAGVPIKIAKVVRDYPNSSETDGYVPVTSTVVYQQGTSPLSKLENKLKEDASAAMEMRELTRQHNINLGKIGIDQAFSKFGDDYYQKYRDDYTGYYFPQLDEQYSKVTDKMTAALADRGVLSSSISSNKFADLAKEHSNARTNISNEALDASNKLRAQVENAKGNLYSLNEASADPQAVNAQAIGQATALVAPPTYSPLGNIFAGVLDAFGNYMSARQNRPYQNQSGYVSPYPSGYGSGRVVR